MTLYTNLGEDGIVHGINQVEVEVLVTRSVHYVIYLGAWATFLRFSSQDLLPKVIDLRDRIPSLKTVVVFESSFGERKMIYLKQNDVTIVPFRHVESLGEAQCAKVGDHFKHPSPHPEDVAVIMYTSGSTGEPKGVMLTHANLVASLMACCALACNLLGEERHHNEAYLAYLPLAHIFELTHEIIVLSLGIRVGYSSPMTLTDNSTAILPGHRGDMTVLRPTVMPAVPVILDRIYKGLRSKIAAKGMFFTELFDYFVRYDFATFFFKQKNVKNVRNIFLFLM